MTGNMNKWARNRRGGHSHIVHRLATDELDAINAAYRINERTRRENAEKREAMKKNKITLPFFKSKRLEKLLQKIRDGGFDECED